MNSSHAHRDEDDEPEPSDARGEPGPESAGAPANADNAANAKNASDPSDAADEAEDRVDRDDGGDDEAGGQHSFLDEFIMDLEQAADKAAVLENYCRQFPDQEQRLRSTFRFYEQMGSIASTAGPGAGVPLSERRLPERFGDFQILRIVDVGGMGVVYEAIQLSLNRRVAIKTLRNPAAAPRFINEQQCLAQFYQANIVPLYETGNCDGIPYLVMPFIDGATLNKVVSAANRLLLADHAASQPSSIGGLAEWSSRPPHDTPGHAPTDAPGSAGAPRDAGSGAHHGVPRMGPAYFHSVARCVVDIARAIADSHRLNIVHRDLKPENVMVNKEGHAFIIDFGLASPPESAPEASDVVASIGAEAALRDASGIFGTPDYMAPEQFLGQFDRVTDVWGVGTILYELLALRRAYRGTPRDASPRPPRDWNPRVPRDLEAIALRCLQLDPHDRYRSAAEVAEELERWLRYLPVIARPPSVSERLAKWSRRNTGLAATIGFVILGTVATLLGLVLHNSSVQTMNTQLVAQARELRDANEQVRAQERVASGYNYGLQMRSGFDFYASANLNAVADVLQFTEQLERLAGGKTLRGWEWFLLNGACQAERMTLRGHEAAVTSVTYDPQESLLVSGDAAGTIRVWNRSSGACQRTFAAHTGAVTGLAFNSDGSVLASAGRDSEVRLWRRPEWEDAGALPAHILPIVAVHHHPGQPQWLTASEDRRVILWDAQGVVVHTLQHTHPLRDAAYSPDGTRIVTAVQGELSVWDTETGTRIQQLPTTRKLTKVRFTPDGKKVFCGCEPGSGEDLRVPLLVCDLESGEFVRRVDKIMHTVRDLAISADGQFAVTAGSDRVLRVYNTTYGNLLRLIRGHRGEVNCVAVHSPGGEISSGGADRAVRLWDRQPNRLFCELRGHALNIKGLSFRSDGQRLVSGSYDHSVRIWDTVSGQLLHTFGTQQIERDPRSGNVRYLEATDGHLGSVMDVTFSPDGKHVASAGFDNTARVWDAESGEELTILNHRAAVMAVCYSPDGRYLATASWDDVITIWDMETKLSVHVLRGHRGHIDDLVYCQDGHHLASASADGSIGLWNTDNGQRERWLTGHDGKVRSLACSPDGRLLASGGEDWSIRVWDLMSGTQQMVMWGHTATVEYVAFHPTEPRLASASSGTNDRTVRFWDLTTGVEAGRLAACGPITFGPQGSRLAMVGPWQTIEIWDNSRGKQLSTLLSEPTPPPAAQPPFQLPVDGGLKTRGYFLADELRDARDQDADTPWKPAEGKRYLVVVLSVPTGLLMPPPRLYERLAQAARAKGEPIADADRIAIYAAELFLLRNPTETDAEPRAAALIGTWPGFHGMVRRMDRTLSESLNPADREGLLVAWEVDATWSAQFPEGLPQIHFLGREPVPITPQVIAQ